MLRTWNEQLYMDAMPGRYEPFDLWLKQLEHYKIDRVICLTDEHEIAAKSPDYHAARAAWRRAVDGTPHIPIDGAAVPLTDFPLPDFGAPAGPAVAHFWELAASVAVEIAAGKRVFIHCGAGIGRTGTFAAAVLMHGGASVEEATRQIQAAGSGPERPAQWELLEGGDPEIRGNG